MASERDLFANFERMRREMDELFGHAEHRLTPRRRGGFVPAVDVHYEDGPPRAVVEADLAGVDPGDVELEIRGRELVLSGVRRPNAADGCVYQQVEIARGPFRRAIALGADVDADAARARYEGGLLVVEIPLAVPARRVRQVPIEDTRG